MKFRLLLRIRGIGRVGSSVVGLSTGTISVLKYCSSHCRCARRPIVAPHEADALVAQRRNQLVVEHAVLLADEQRGSAR